ncbi:DNA gyrase subunit A [Streptomyces sp. M10(2022)]
MGTAVLDAAPLVDGHGNFGSLGNDDPPAAMRYTECRMADATSLMTESIDEDTVDFQSNYDGQEREPVVLPAAYPNLLVNGSSGIAVGMATNMPPHNLGEIIAAARHLIRHPGADLEALMRFVRVPTCRRAAVSSASAASRMPMPRGAVRSRSARPSPSRR